MPEKNDNNESLTRLLYIRGAKTTDRSAGKLSTFVPSLPYLFNVELLGIHTQDCFKSEVGDLKTLQHLVLIGYIVYF